MTDELSPTDAAAGGLVGIASTAPVTGTAMIEALECIRRRGNGLGGGVALVGCFPRFRAYYALSVALLPFGARREIEEMFIAPDFDIHDFELQPELDDYRQLSGLAARPPGIVRYFVRARPGALDEFAARNGFDDPAAAEDELVAQWAHRLNRARYTGHAEETAFMLSFGRDMMVVKGIGDADAVARFYRLEQQPAYVWLGCQGYPTRAHLGGASPFAALGGALALDGAFTNRRALVGYLEQRGYRPGFRADAELGALLFDLYTRGCAYPLPLALEALVPSSAAGLARLSAERRERYRLLQHTHAHGIPGGAVFIAVARNVPHDNAWQLAGAVDADARRPNVFALQERARGGVGMVASEYQAIEAAFERLAVDHGGAASPVPDRVWTAREFGPEGADDGGAYIFTLKAPPPDEAARGAPPTLSCMDKFGRFVTTDRARMHEDGPGAAVEVRADLRPLTDFINTYMRTDFSPQSAPALGDAQIETMYRTITASFARWSFATLNAWLDQIVGEAAAGPALRTPAVELLTRLYDRVQVYETGAKKRSAVRARLGAALTTLFGTVPTSAREADPSDPDRRLTWVTLATRGLPLSTRGTLYIDAGDLPLEGSDRLAQVLVRAYRAGWRWFVIFGCKGDRFVGAGLGPDTNDAWIDIYGVPGDYLAAGLDGAEIHVHGPAQDWAGYSMARGRLVVYGDVGQAFLYGATGGAAHVMGYAGARAFAGARGDARAVISGIVDGAVPAPQVYIAPSNEDPAWRELVVPTLLQQNAAFFGLP
ncbi:MAG: hypothetical protein JXB47_06760 [Anaerolineae bacterium]|nr:hypothetical protein [Anaerolineae bacterium]